MPFLPFTLSASKFSCFMSCPHTLSVTIDVHMITRSGRLPWSDDDGARAREISSASYSLQGSVWSGVSSEAKAFISELIQVDPERRLTAERCRILFS